MLVSLSLPAAAQDAVGGRGIIGSESLRVTVYPTAALEGENALGVLGRFAYGVSDDLSVDGRLGLYGDLLYFAAQARLAAGQLGGVTLGLGAGLHRTDFEGAIDVFGFDTLLLASYPVGGEVNAYGAVDFDFERPSGAFANFTRAHVVGGLEARLSTDLRVLAEFGVAANGASTHYFSVGVSLSLR